MDALEQLFVDLDAALGDQMQPGDRESLRSAVESGEDADAAEDYLWEAVEGGAHLPQTMLDDIERLFLPLAERFPQPATMRRYLARLRERVAD